MSLMKKIGRRASFLSVLLRENNPLPVFRHLTCSRLGIRPEKTDTLSIHGHQVVLRRSTPDLVVALTTLGGEFEILKRYFDGDFSGLIIDAGGYIGTAALAFSDAFPNAKIVSIEASSKNVEQARKNTSKRTNITILNAALTYSGAPSALTLRDRGTGAWGFTIVENPADRNTDVLETVETTTIEKILVQTGFDKASIVKLDIEGAELELFHSPEWLTSTEVLLVELHERIAPGCEEAFALATKGRENTRAGGEKYISSNLGNI